MKWLSIINVFSFEIASNLNCKKIKLKKSIILTMLFLLSVPNLISGEKKLCDFKKNQVK